MAPSQSESVKSILTDVHKFVNVTLKSESLSKKAEGERTKLVEALEKFYASNYHLAPSSGDEGSTSSHKTPSISGSIDDSKNTCDSHGSEEDYDDNIPPSNVKGLENATKYGFLDYKRQKGIFSSWGKRYFVLHKRIMYCFKKPSDQKQTCAFLVSGYELQDSPQHIKDAKRKECCFELLIPGKKSHQFIADSKEDLLAWKEVLQAALKSDTARDDLVAEEDDDLYEPLPGDADFDGGAPQISPRGQSQSDKVPTFEITTDEPEEDDVYDDGQTDNKEVASPATPQQSPSSSKAGIFSKIFKKKDADAVDKKKNEETKVIGDEPVKTPNEFEDVDDIYDDVAGAPIPTPVSELRPPPSPSPAAVTKKTEEKPPPPKSPSMTSATQAPSNVPKLPSRGPVPHPTSPTPSLPPRQPPTSQPPPLPDRDLPPLPERDLPPLPQRDLPPLPPGRDPPPRPPNMPVPPIPSESSPKGPHAIKPTLDKKICHARDEDYENLYFSAYTCRGASDSELTFDRGDLIHVISRDLEPYSWWVGELAGKIGLVPKAFLVPAFTEVN